MLCKRASSPIRKRSGAERRTDADRPGARTSPVGPGAEDDCPLADIRSDPDTTRRYLADRGAPTMLGVPILRVTDCSEEYSVAATSSAPPPSREIEILETFALKPRSDRKCSALQRDEGRVESHRVSEICTRCGVSDGRSSRSRGIPQRRAVLRSGGRLVCSPRGQLHPSRTAGVVRKQRASPIALFPSWNASLKSNRPIPISSPEWDRFEQRDSAPSHGRQQRRDPVAQLKREANSGRS